MSALFRFGMYENRKSPLYLGSFIKQKTTFVILKIVSALFRFEIPKNGKSPLYLGPFM